MSTIGSSFAAIPTTTNATRVHAAMMAEAVMFKSPNQVLLLSFIQHEFEATHTDRYESQPHEIHTPGDLLFLLQVRRILDHALGEEQRQAGPRAG